MLWKGTVFLSAWHNWKKNLSSKKSESKEACNIPAFYPVKCAIAVNLAEMSSEGGALASASVPSVSAGVRLCITVLHQLLPHLCGRDCLVQKDA